MGREWMRPCDGVLGGGVGAEVEWRVMRGVVEVRSGGWLLWPPSPGGLPCENSETRCVCVVWPYPGWRVDGSVFSPSSQPAGPLAHNILLCFLHQLLMAFGMGRREEREERVVSTVCILSFALFSAFL